MACFTPYAGGANAAFQPADCSEGVPGTFVPTVTPGPISIEQAVPGALAPSNGFGLYINGERYIFQLTGGVLPPAGTQWTLRTYSGVVRAAAGSAAAGTLPSGTHADRVHLHPAVVRSPAVAGLKVKFTVTAPTSTVATTNLDLTRVHTVPDPYYVTNGYRGHD